MGKNKNSRKRKPCKIEVTNDQKSITISTDELKELIISAIKEERAKEDDASFSNLSGFLRIFVLFVYVLFYFADWQIIFESFSIGITSLEEGLKTTLYIILELLLIFLGYNIAKSKSKNDISQHFTVLTTLIALSIAVFLR